MPRHSDLRTGLGGRFEFRCLAGDIDDKGSTRSIRGASKLPLQEVTIGEVIDVPVAKWPEQRYWTVLRQGMCLTWTQLTEQADQICDLLSLGLRKRLLRHVATWLARMELTV